MSDFRFVRYLLLVGSAALLAIAAPVGCGSREESSRVRIAATIPPLAWVARGLAPEGAEVSVLTPAGASPHTAEPTPASVARFVRADVVLRVGLGFEPAAARALEKHPDRDRREVVFARLLTDAEREAVHGHAHADHDDAHEDAHEHDHGPLDPHLWLDPELMARLVPAAQEVIEEALAAHGLLDEAARRELDERAEALLEEIERVDAAYIERLVPLRGRPLVCAHDAYFWLTRRYGLEVAGVVRPIHGVEPTAGDLAEAARIVRESGVSAIFTEPQLPGGAARRLAELTGVRLLSLDPLGDGDWPAMMRRNLDALVEGLSGADEGSSG